MKFQWQVRSVLLFLLVSLSNTKAKIEFPIRLEYVYVMQTIKLSRKINFLYP